MQGDAVGLSQNAHGPALRHFPDHLIIHLPHPYTRPSLHHHILTCIHYISTPVPRYITTSLHAYTTSPHPSLATSPHPYMHTLHLHTRPSLHHHILTCIHYISTPVPRYITTSLHAYTTSPHPSLATSPHPYMHTLHLHTRPSLHHHILTCIHYISTPVPRYITTSLHAYTTSPHPSLATSPHPYMHTLHLHTRPSLHCYIVKCIHSSLHPSLATPLPCPPPPPPFVIPPPCDPPRRGLLCCSLCAGAHYQRRLVFLFRHKCMPQGIMSGTQSRSRGVPLLATVIGPSPSGPEFLYYQYRGTLGVVARTAAKLCRLQAARASSLLSLGCPDHSPQPALTATPQAPPPTLQAPLPKHAPKRGVKPTLQKSIDQFVKPNIPTINAIVGMCYRCCACSASVIKWYGFVVQSPTHGGDCHFIPPCQSAIQNEVLATSRGPQIRHSPHNQDVVL